MMKLTLLVPLLIINVSTDAKNYKCNKDLSCVVVFPMLR